MLYDNCFCFQKPVMYGFIIGGWTVGVYFIQLLWDNIRLILKNYLSHLISYVIFTGLVSFVVCYRFGPITDHRTKNLIKWALQVCIIKSNSKNHSVLKYLKNWQKVKKAVKPT